MMNLKFYLIMLLSVLPFFQIGAQTVDESNADEKPKIKRIYGGWSVNDDPQMTYDSDHSEPGMIYKIGTNKIIMVFLAPDEQSFEIYELT